MLFFKFLLFLCLISRFDVLQEGGTLNGWLTDEEKADSLAFKVLVVSKLRNALVGLLFF